MDRLLPCVVIALILAIYFFLRRRGSVITNLRVGFFDLTDGVEVEAANSDKQVFREIFGELIESKKTTPKCDILIMHAHFFSDGTIKGSSLGLREIIRDAGAKVVVVASENAGGSYVKAGKQKQYGRANLVMTIARRGDCFASFFRELFSQMKNGASMPTAWVRLAPQVHGRSHDNCPETIFSCELGQVRFKVNLQAKP
jgi:hypothetical protein